MDVTAAARQRYADVNRLLWQAQVDMGTALCTLFTAVGVLRAPAMLRFAASAPALEGNPFPGVVAARARQEAARTVVEWLCAVLCAPVVLLPWRLPMVCREIPADTYWVRRRFVLQQSLQVLLDAPCFALGLPVLLSLYRAPSFMREMYGAHADMRREVRGARLG